LPVLERYVGERLELVRLSNDTPWEVLHEAMLATVRQVAADWVLFLDADEFWLPATGALRDCVLLEDHDVITVNRFNVALTQVGPAMSMPPVPAVYDGIHLYVRRIHDLRSHVDAEVPTPWIRGAPLPKVMARTGVLDAVMMGGHDVAASPGRKIRRGTATDLVIAHVPYSGLPRFRRRVANITDFLTRNPTYFRDGEGWHWKRLRDLAAHDRETEEYERQVTDMREIEELTASDSIRTAAQVLGLD
jgi:hypothetical protein